MTNLEHALALAKEGFWVFPIVAGKKAPPAITNWQEAAMRDPAVIQSWWGQNPVDNIGISTGQFLDNEALLVVDVDMKGGKNGDAELLRLELEGRELPDTYTQNTPSGGRHLVYRVSTSVRQGANVLGPGVDIRSRGGYVVGRGSTVPLGTYTGNAHPVALAPDWLVQRCGTPADGRVREPERHLAVAAPSAPDRARWYLLHEAPVAVEGQGGDETTFKVACKVKDFGVVYEDAVALLRTHWNDRCVPPWEAQELRRKVSNAYRYGTGVMGAASPEKDFAEVEVDPDSTDAAMRRLNKQYAFVTAGGNAHILYETTDEENRFVLDHLDVGAFKLKLAPEKIQVGRSMKSVANVWLDWEGRRSYDGLVFKPAQQASPRFYNLWRGYSYPAAQKGATHPAVDAFLDHALNNVCGGDRPLFRWLMGFFAHLVQRPFDKPLVALVFRGEKGVGKNAFVERLGALLGCHFLVASHERYLVGNFNSHLEKCLLFVLDEAMWAGDKKIEGLLKGMITGRDHIVERKGKEAYMVANKTRVVILGNEDWLVPASHDERRFAVFTVGPGRKQDLRFFQTMREGLESGGYSVLLRYLLDYDLTGVDVNIAPKTQGLSEQVQQTLEPLRQWWSDCLFEGRLMGADFVGWPEDVECEAFRTALRRYTRDRNITTRIPDDRSIGRTLKQCAPSIHRHRLARRDDDTAPWAYRMPALAQGRAEWDRFIGQPIEWPE